jgi:hypothetical protein
MYAPFVGAPHLPGEDSFPSQRRANLGSVVLDSGSESDVPLRKKRKFDESSRASTPRLATTPKGMLFQVTKWGGC